MTLSPEPHDEAVDRLLAEHKRALAEGLGSVLDVETGLREILLQSHHDSAVDDLDSVLDVEGGLSAVLPTEPSAGPNIHSDSRETPRVPPSLSGRDRAGDGTPHRGQTNAGSSGGISKGLRRVEVALKWDPNPAGQSPADLDLVAAAYLEADPYGQPAYLVHFDSRSPDGTIYLNRDSKDGKGFGWDEVMAIELDRLDSRYTRVVVGVMIQQRPAQRTFVSVTSPALRIREGYTVLAEDDFAGVLGSTAATVAEFVREGSSTWDFRAGIHGFEDDPATFTAIMGRARP